ncbi:hypothetical protein DEJ43_14985 [Streptomyces venezuelae ATCC 10712]|nr:hypothetical protein vnz_14805 [Streptomyces venezuelae]QER99547.1 hypothetical protein DEJ43_14985 [Streptomyces venezuelae ATCC 10712]
MAARSARRFARALACLSASDSRRDATRLDALERARWPLPSVAALAGAGGLALSVWTYIAR